MPVSLGVLGGTFNPPHLGHLALARCAREQLGLERVLLVPSCVPPHKHPEADPGAEQRLSMCFLAAEGHPGLEASPLEVERGGPSYTVDTLTALHEHPLTALHERPEVSLTLIVGSDVACTLPSWRRPHDVLELASLAVAARAGDSREEVLAAVRSLGGPDPVFLQMPTIDVSSSLVRARVASGESIEGLVPPAVGAYIAEHQLYRHPAGVSALQRDTCEVHEP
jgi:nicotinate-nucleotide adenylyltransferase